MHTLASLALQLRLTTHLNLFTISLLSATESHAPIAPWTPHLLRLLTPVLKATVAKSAMPFLSECMESLGGQGYVEEGQIAVLYRDAQVNTIWEGTTNVLSVDVFRVLRGRTREECFGALDGWVVQAVLTAGKCPGLKGCADKVREKYEVWKGDVRREMAKEGVSPLAREVTLRLGWIVSVVEMLIDAAFDGDEVEVECCRRVVGVDPSESLEWDRKIVFGEGKQVVARL
jgi:Acyl-CoA dehydrogenase, C-terminal domain